LTFLKLYLEAGGEKNTVMRSKVCKLAKGQAPHKTHYFGEDWSESKAQMHISMENQAPACMVLTCTGTH